MATIPTRLEMEALINEGRVVLFNGKIYHTIAELPTQEEIDEVYTVGVGVQGFSAYDIAVQEGFVGTEAEWLESLKGEQGEQGEQGIQGVAGDGSVDSVNGDAGPDIILDTDDISEGATNKYVTAAEKTKLSNLSGTNTGDQDLSGLVPNTRTVNGHALSSNVTVTKSDVGLGNVDNTSDASKPVSTATQTALDAKQNSLGFTAVPNTRTINGQPLSSDVTISGGSSPVFVQTAVRTVDNTTTESTILGTGTGSLTLAANNLVVGKTYRLTIRGNIQGAGTRLFKIKLGSTVLAQSSAVSAPFGGTSNALFEMQAMFTCYSTGASGSVWAHGKVWIQDNNDTSNFGFMQNLVSTAAATINTTTSNVFDATMTMGTATSGFRINTHTAVLEALN